MLKQVTLAKFVSVNKETETQVGPGLLCSNFYLLCFWVVLKKSPIMLNIMPIIISIMSQLNYK